MDGTLSHGEATPPSPLSQCESSNQSITEQHDRDDSDDSDSSDYSGDSDDDLAHVDRFTRDYRKWRGKLSFFSNDSERQ
ncbi:hypothetical protein J6590_009718 [Homalodisca vitripennis]|nr:hypothetical protein J6590_009718 [Homalodisca vitripennis]